jgi:carbon monoxide dehydrogenase subunit G
VALKIGPVSATFKGSVELQDMDPPRRSATGASSAAGAPSYCASVERSIITPARLCDCR